MELSFFFFFKMYDIWLSLNMDGKGPCGEKGDDRWSTDEKELVAGDHSQGPGMESRGRERRVLARQAGLYFLC